MATDYEKFYQENPHGLGEPFKEFVAFFKTYPKTQASILDLGCGQGRDALFISRLGHNVTGVDISKTGIEQLLRDADTERLDITGIVADITEYQPKELFDVIGIDRTLHMLPKEQHRLEVLKTMITCVAKDGYILIADERKNLPVMKILLEASGFTSTFEQKGFLFVQKSL